MIHLLIFLPQANCIHVPFAVILMTAQPGTPWRPVLYNVSISACNIIHGVSDFVLIYIFSNIYPINI